MSAAGATAFARVARSFNVPSLPAPPLTVVDTASKLSLPSLPWQPTKRETVPPLTSPFSVPHESGVLPGFPASRAMSSGP